MNVGLPRVRVSILLIAALAACAFAWVGAAGASEEPEPAVSRFDKDKDVLFIHGYDVFAENEPGGDCAATWRVMRAWFDRVGWSGRLIAPSYYSGDFNCGTFDGTKDFGISRHHRPGADGHAADEFYGGSEAHDCCDERGYTAHTRDAHIGHLSYHFAWFVYNNWQSGCPDSPCRQVDVVAHSMGGLIVRYALAQVQRDNGRFPRHLRIEDVITLGTPHRGALPALACGLFSSAPLQCQQMNPLSKFMDYINNSNENYPCPECLNPQGSLRTQWSTLGSEHDGAVSEQSATAIGAIRVNYKWPEIGHSDYLTRSDDVWWADVGWKPATSSTWYPWNSAPLPVQWADNGAARGDM